MLNAGANLALPSRGGTTALHWAVFAAWPSEVHAYSKLGEPHETFWIPRQTAPLVELLLARGARVSVVDNYGNTPLHQAALLDVLPAVPLLLAAGALRTLLNHDGKTPLQLATERHNSVVNALK